MARQPGCPKWWTWGRPYGTFRGLIQVADWPRPAWSGLRARRARRFKPLTSASTRASSRPATLPSLRSMPFFPRGCSTLNSGDYTAPGTLTIPGGGANTRPLADQGYSVPELGFQDTFTGPTPLADAQAVYQTGTYTFDLPAGSQPEAIVSQSYAGDAFPNVPLVTNLSTLQNLNAATFVTFDFEPMVVSPNATPGDNYIFSISTMLPPTRLFTVT